MTAQNFLGLLCPGMLLLGYSVLFFAARNPAFHFTNHWQDEDEDEDA